MLLWMVLASRREWNRLARLTGLLGLAGEERDLIEAHSTSNARFEDRLDMIRCIIPMPGGTFTVVLNNNEEFRDSRLQSRHLRERILRL
jgi:hypothetical protein